MLSILFLLFCLTALGGLSMLIIRIKGRPQPPLWLALVHGVAAVTSVGLLAKEWWEGTMPTFGEYALGFFVLAAGGGLTLFLFFHLRNRALPIPFILGHGCIALTGLVLLFLAV